MPLRAPHATRMVAPAAITPAAITPAAMTLAAMTLAALTLAACGGGAAGVARVATGGCLGRVCLGMSEQAAIVALGAGAVPAADAVGAGDTGAGGPGTHGVPPGGRHCYRLPDGGFYSFWVDEEDPSRRVTGVLATATAHCSAPVAIGDAGMLATCRGVRLGDSDAFVAKMDRHAVEEEKPDDPWPEAPLGTRHLDDDCGAGAPGGYVTSLYVAGGKVTGLAVREAQ